MGHWVGALVLGMPLFPLPELGLRPGVSLGLGECRDPAEGTVPSVPACIQLACIACASGKVTGRLKHAGEPQPLPGPTSS